MSIQDQKIPCHNPGCKGIAVKVVFDSKGRKSYRCSNHAQVKKPTKVKQ